MSNSNPTLDPKESKALVLGVVKEILPDTKYLVEISVELDGTELKHELICYPSGKIRKFYIKILEGDQVVVELDSYGDLSVGRIIFKKDPRRALPEFAKPNLTSEVLAA